MRATVRRLSSAATALAAVWLLGALAGTAEAQTKSCARNCLAPYAAQPTPVQREVKPKCRAACNAVRAQRKACLNEVNVIFKNASKTCSASLKGIKRGQAPLSVSIPIGDSFDGNATNQVVTFFYEPGCKQAVKQLWNDAKITCNEILCPDGQYWDTPSQGCIVNPNNGPQTPPLLTATPIPSVIRGFYKWSWTGSSYQGPPDTNMGVTFTGWTPANPSQANIAPITTASIKLLSYGGGNANGAWDLSRVQAAAAQSNLNDVISLGYNGIVLDIEECSQTVSVADWNALFAAIKAAKLLCIVTISHFSPYGCSNGQELVNSMLQSSTIDILSPQLYTSGSESQNDWTGYSDAWRSSVPAVAPSIVQASYYDQLGPNSVTSYLPNAKGYFVWSNTAPTPPGPTPDCVSGYFPGSGCWYMCDWCRQQLGTDQYYWTDGVCTYSAQSGGCAGNPLAGVQYTCCKAK